MRISTQDDLLSQSSRSSAGTGTSDKGLVQRDLPMPSANIRCLPRLRRRQLLVRLLLKVSTKITQSKKFWRVLASKRRRAGVCSMIRTASRAVKIEIRESPPSNKEKSAVILQLRVSIWPTFPCNSLCHLS